MLRSLRAGAACAGLLAPLAWLACSSSGDLAPGGDAGREGGAEGAVVTDTGVRDDDAEASIDAGDLVDGRSDAALPDGAIVFDLGADFSTTQNPNGAWRYGFTTGHALAPDQFQLDAFLAQDAGDPVAIWHPSSNDPSSGYYPYVGANTGDAAVTEFASWALRAHEIAMEGSNVGQYSVAQLVAPRAGTYQIHAHFEGVHFRLSSTDVHVLANATELFAADIDGYGGDPDFHAVEGTSPTADYVGSASLQAGDTISFAVGYGSGAGATNYNDTTSLTAHVVVE